MHGPSTKTRVAYILSLLRGPAKHGNESTVIEEEEDDSDVEDGDITLLNTEVMSLISYSFGRDNNSCFSKVNPSVKEL